MRVSSVRVRLLVWNTGVLAIALFGFQFLALLMIRANLQDDIDNRLTSMAEGPAHFFSRDEEDHPPPPPPPNQAQQQHTHPHWTPPGSARMQHMVRAFDLQGKGLSHPEDFNAIKEVPWDRVAFARAVGGHDAFSITHDSDNTLVRVFSRPLVRNGKRIGVVQVATSYEEMQTLLHTLATLMFILVPCVLLVAGVGGVVLTDRALRPVRHIIRTAETLKPDDLSQRLPAVGSDEFAHLATTMNGMLGRIETAFSKLRQTLERERRFTADASHELRTPLTVIAANTTLTLEGETTLEEYHAAMQAINLSAIMMRRLVEDLLLLARSESGQLHLACEEVDVRDLMTRAIAMVRKDAQAEMRLDIAGEGATLWGDSNHLLRVLINLLENAARHTPADGSITLASLRSDGQVTLSVADTGEGIAAEHLAHLGERFYRLEASRARRHGGTGLGIAICKGIVEAHGGTLTVDSTVGQGTIVTITLRAQP